MRPREKSRSAGSQTLQYKRHPRRKSTPRLRHGARIGHGEDDGQGNDADHKTGGLRHLLKRGTNMRYMVILLMLLLTAPILHSADSPLKATNVAMHVLQYRQYFPDQNGWKPQYKAELDVTLQNVSQSAIDMVKLCLSSRRDPNGHQQMDCNGGSAKFTISLQPGHSTKIEWPDLFTFRGDSATGSFTYAGMAIDVGLVSSTYSNGRLADFGDFGVFIGQGIIPSPMKFPAKTVCEEPVDLTAEMSAPRVFDNGHSPPLNAFNFGISTKLPPGIQAKRVLETITYQVVIGSDGSVCDVSILKDSLGPQGVIGIGGSVRGLPHVPKDSLGPRVYPYRTEGLKTLTWFPAMENGVPVTVRMVKSTTIEHTVSQH